MQADTADSEAPQALTPESDADADAELGANADPLLPEDGLVIPGPLGAPAAADGPNRVSGDRAGRVTADSDAEGATDADADGATDTDADGKADTDTDGKADTDTEGKADTGRAAQRPRVLPENFAPPSDVESANAQSALAKLGANASPQDLLHGDPGHPDATARAEERARANAEWWNPLSADEKTGMVRAHPEVIGNAPGIDAVSANDANRLQMARKLSDLIGRDDLTRAERKQLANLRATVRALAAAQLQAAAVDPDLPVHVVAYDSTAFGGKGRAAVAFGNIDTADHLSWHVAGKHGTVAQLGASLSAALNQYQSSVAKVRTGESIASIAWVGYDAPAGAGSSRSAGVHAWARQGGCESAAA